MRVCYALHRIRDVLFSLTPIVYHCRISTKF
jgi:hypothetical protein